MAKGVLGNDPFQRGAAQRAPKKPEPDAATTAAAPPPAEEKRSKQPSPPAARKRKARKDAAPAAVETNPASGHQSPADGKGAALPHPRQVEGVAARIRASTPEEQPELTYSRGRPFVDDAPEAPRPLPRKDARAPLVDRAMTSAAFLRTLLRHALSNETFHRARQLATMAGQAIAQSIGALSNPILDPYGKDAQLVARLEPVARFLYEDYWRVDALDALNIPDGPSLLVANHSGAIPFDGPMLRYAVQKERPDLQEPRWLVEDQIFDAPVVGTVFNRIGAVRASPENALRLLDERRPVIVFPEGIHGMGKPFAERYQLKRFGRGGFVKLALRTGAPIVPVAIIGAEEAAPLLGRLPPGIFGLDYVPITPLGPIPLPSKWMIRFGEPIRPEGSPDDPEAIERTTQQTRATISQMLQDLLRERKAVFR